MKRTTLYLTAVFSCLLFFPALAWSEGNPIYYGFLPGTDYKYFNALQKIDLKGKSFNLEIVDSRGSIQKLECFEYGIDRKTELEGDLGLNYFRNYLTTMIEQSNGRVDPQSPNKVVVKLEGISFMQYGFIFSRIHGLAQFDVSSDGVSKKYCSNMTDADKDSPLGQFSFVTRKTAGRLIVSGSMRRALEAFMADLQK